VPENTFWLGAIATDGDDQAEEELVTLAAP
jgi:hypothetical protein